MTPSLSLPILKNGDGKKFSQALAVLWLMGKQVNTKSSIMSVLF